MNKKSIYIALAFFIALIGSIPLFLKTETEVIFPFVDEKNMIVDFYAEPVPDSLKSNAEIFQSQDSIVLKYHLSSALNEPFVGLFIHPKDTSQAFFSFKDFDQIQLNLSSERGSNFPVTFTLDYQGFTNEEKPITNLPFSSNINYQNKGNYNLDLNNFSIAPWWLRHHQKSVNDFNHLDFNRVNYLVIESCKSLSGGSNDQLTIYAISLVHSNERFWILWSILFLVGIMFFIFYAVYNSRKKVLIPIASQEFSVEKDKKIDSITMYIAHHYHDPNLTQLEMQNELGISAREIGLALKSNFNTSFKNYLNHIRLVEVKRLLKSSDLPVSDIAYKCGYNNISHFNRVFKNETGISPNQYRESI